MKRVLLLFYIFSIFNVNGQNEFAASAFYKDFQKIYEDAKNDFVLFKGAKRESKYEELASEFKVKLLLPLADSGKIVVPVTGIPYVIYYFEPQKMRLKVDQLGANLRDALLDVLGIQLMARTETTIVNKYPLTNTWFFIDPKESRLAMADFRMSIYYQDNKYYLSFEIRGKKE